MKSPPEMRQVSTRRDKNKGCACYDKFTAELNQRLIAPENS